MLTAAVHGCSVFAMHGCTVDACRMLLELVQSNATAAVVAPAKSNPQARSCGLKQMLRWFCCFDLVRFIAAVAFDCTDSALRTGAVGRALA